MNVKDYRRQVESSLTNPGDEHTVDVAALDEAPMQASWGEAIKQLADSALDTDTRQAALQQLQAGTFLSSEFDTVRAEYLAALRKAAVDRNPSLRQSALDILVNLKDDFARQKLQDGLRGIGEQLLPAAAALGLLARDDHSSASQIARDLLGKSGDVPLRAQAARLLGADPSAMPLLSELMKNKDEFREVRRASAVALQSLDPTVFAQQAREILSDHSDFGDIKATVKGALDRAGIGMSNPSPGSTDRPTSGSGGGVVRSVIDTLRRLFSDRIGS